MKKKNRNCWLRQDMERLQMALARADAVYHSGYHVWYALLCRAIYPRRAENRRGTVPQQGVRVHVTCNTMPAMRGGPAPGGWSIWTAWERGCHHPGRCGTLALAKRHPPRQCHISTQASIVNYQSATAWHDLGASRVILAQS